MLQDEGCDPHIIRWDRSALPSQLPENREAHENAKLWIEPMQHSWEWNRLAHVL